MKYLATLSIATSAFMLAACAGTMHHSKGIQYKAENSSMALSVACVDRISRMPNGNALAIELKSGECEDQFDRFAASHKGQMLSAYFEGDSLGTPAKIISRMHSPLVQPVQSTDQADSIMKYYSTNK